MDVNGRLVEKLVMHMNRRVTIRSPGMPSGLENGVIFHKILVNGVSASNRMILMR